MKNINETLNKLLDDYEKDSKSSFLLIVLLILSSEDKIDEEVINRIEKIVIDDKNRYANYELEMLKLQKENEQLMKALEEKENWLSICILKLMKEYKTDTIWITSQQIESNKNKNICYEVYKNNDVKFYQNKK